MLILVSVVLFAKILLFVWAIVFTSIVKSLRARQEFLHRIVVTCSIWPSVNVERHANLLTVASNGAWLL